jgi:hypothetical protein
MARLKVDHDMSGCKRKKLLRLYTVLAEPIDDETSVAIKKTH